MKIGDFRKNLACKCIVPYSRITLKAFKECKPGRYRILVIVRKIINFNQYNYGFCKLCKSFKYIKNFIDEMCCLKRVSRTIFLKIQGMGSQKSKFSLPRYFRIKHVTQTI